MSRRSLADSPWNYFAEGYLADANGVNYTAVCESRGGMCVRAADCATNSAVDLTGTGSRYTSQADHLGDSGSSDQIRSFLCNLTAICCLPQPTDTGVRHFCTVPNVTSPPLNGHCRHCQSFCNCRFQPTTRLKLCHAD